MAEFSSHLALPSLPLFLIIHPHQTPFQPNQYPQPQQQHLNRTNQPLPKLLLIQDQEEPQERPQLVSLLSAAALQL
jgi:hypothetical protein